MINIQEIGSKSIFSQDETVIDNVTKQIFDSLHKECN